MKRLIILLSLVLPLSAFAQQKPISMPEDKRIKRVAYSANNVVPIFGVAFTSTQIELGNDEIILDVEGGDTDGWKVTVQDNIRNMLFLKPTVLGSHSNITVVTNKRNYYFDVRSAKTLQTSVGQTYAVKFIYPEEERQRLKGQLAKRQRENEAIVNHKNNPKQYNWDYAFNGDKSIMPAHVFDDGTFTYLELRPHQEVPAVFVVDNAQGAEAIANVSRQGNYLVIHRTAPQFTLRSGRAHVASLFNNPHINNIRRGLA